MAVIRDLRTNVMRKAANWMGNRIKKTPAGQGSGGGGGLAQGFGIRGGGRAGDGYQFREGVSCDAALIRIACRAKIRYALVSMHYQNLGILW